MFHLVWEHVELESWTVAEVLFRIIWSAWCQHLNLVGPKQYILNYLFFILSCCDEDITWHNLSSDSQIIWICFTYPSGKESREAAIEIMRPFTHNTWRATGQSFCQSRSEWTEVDQSDFLLYCQWNQLATARGVLLLLGVTLNTGHDSVVSCESRRSKAEIIFPLFLAFLKPQNLILLHCRYCSILADLFSSSHYSQAVSHFIFFFVILFLLLFF